MARVLHIACLQTRPMATMQEAIDEAMPMAEAAVRAGAQMLFLPEYCGGLASTGGKFTPPAEVEADHPVLAACQDFARARGVWLQIGSIAVKNGWG